MPKYDQVGDMIRGLLGRNAGGVPLDVSDDVARAAMIANPTRTRYVDMTPESAAQLRAAVDGDPVLSGIEVGPRAGAPDFSGVTRGPMADLPPDLSPGSPLNLDLQASKRRYDGLRYNRTPNLRNQDPQLTRIAGDGIRTKNAARQNQMASDEAFSLGARQLAGAGAGGLAVFGAANMAPDMAFGPGDTAGLAEESRPVPSVEATADEAPAMPTEAMPEEAMAAPDMPEDYSFQARELMNKLNAMRRQAGGEVPEAPQMMAEINRLLGMSNQRRNAPEYQPAMPTDYHGEAQRLIQKLNSMNSEMGGMSPETPKIMAEVRRLQAMGDQMRNAR